MTAKKVLYINDAELRSRAEDRLSENRETVRPPGTWDEPMRLLHELQVHQIELEMQNVELLRARTEREEMEALLGKYCDLYDFAPVGYLNLDRGGNISAVNLTGVGFLGVERSLLIGRRLDLFISDETRLVFHDFLDKVFVSEGKETCEVVFLKDGHPSLFVQVEAVVSESREECRAVVIDITGRTRAEAALQERESRERERATELATVLDAVPTPVIIVHDPESLHMTGNCAADALLRHSRGAEASLSAPAEVRPRHFRALKDGRELRLDELPAQRAARGIFVEDFDFSIVFDDGTTRHVLGYGTPLLNDEGQTHGAVHVLVDITERKQAEEALKKLNEELELRVVERTTELREKDQILMQQSRLAAMGEMIGNIAHQWRQPLNALGLTVQQLRMTYELGEINREFLEDVINSSMEIIQHMSKTIDDFRNYFKPNKDKVEFRLSESMSDTLSLVNASFKDQFIRIELVAKDDPVVYGYRNEFAQALLNILNNARDVLTERKIVDPRVTITIGSEGERAVVIISDNAGGIPEEIMAKIFDPYFTTKGPQRGTGVGLFMSKSIIEKNMGGTLTARNITGGAEFRIEV